MSTGRVDLFASMHIYLCINSRPREALLCKERLCCYPTGAKLQSSNCNPGECRASPTSLGLETFPMQSPSKTTAEEDAPGSTKPKRVITSRVQFLLQAPPAPSTTPLEQEIFPWTSSEERAVGFAKFLWIDHCLSPGGGRGINHLHGATSPSPKPSVQAQQLPGQPAHTARAGSQYSCTG